MGDFADSFLDRQVYGGHNARRAAAEMDAAGRTIARNAVVADGDEIMTLLGQIRSRIDTAATKKNAHGCGWQCGGAYWRVMRVARLLRKQLVKQEGKRHAEFLLSVHGDVDALPGGDATTNPENTKD